jgi:hypothetical protein
VLLTLQNLTGFGFKLQNFCLLASGFGFWLQKYNWLLASAAARSQKQKPEAEAEALTTLVTAMMCAPAKKYTCHVKHKENTAKRGSSHVGASHWRAPPD